MSRNTKGRDREEAPCDIRTVYQRDRDRILHCKSFRRLKHKTQVFPGSGGRPLPDPPDPYAGGGADCPHDFPALQLNEDLTEAIALGHDLGHTPFGHSGERILDELCPYGFAHYKQSVRVVEVLEKDGKGLNLTREVRDGILNHRTSGHPSTLEGCVVRLSDKIAYINHDIDDAIRARIFTEEQLPAKYTDVLGHSVRERLNLLIHDIILQSMDRPEIIMSSHVEEAMQGLRSWMFENVYENKVPKAEEGRAQQLLVFLYQYYLEHTTELPEEYLLMIEKRGEPKERVVCDYIAGMSDSYSIDKFEELFIPKSWKVH